MSSSENLLKISQFPDIISKSREKKKNFPIGHNEFKITLRFTHRVTLIQARMCTMFINFSYKIASALKNFADNATVTLTTIFFYVVSIYINKITSNIVLYYTIIQYTI